MKIRTGSSGRGGGWAHGGIPAPVCGVVGGHAGGMGSWGHLLQGVALIGASCGYGPDAGWRLQLQKARLGPHPPGNVHSDPLWAGTFPPGNSA